MSEPKPDGGQAFPFFDLNTIDDETKPSLIPGMSLRDWFAGQALVGNLANESQDFHYSSDQKRAEHAYNVADAMLAERNK